MYAPSVHMLENRTFEEINIGDTASLKRTVKLEDIQMFAVVSGDVNPAHLDEDYARETRFGQVVAHGMLGGALISAVLGNQLPGPGTIYISQTLHFRRPVKVGDTLTVTVTCREKHAEKKHIILDCVVLNQDGSPVIEGSADVLAPTEKIRRATSELPDILIDDSRRRYEHLLALTHGMAPIRVAVVHPCDAEALRGPLTAAQAGLIEPVLVGPRARIERLADEIELSLDGVELIDTEHSHAAAVEAVRLARTGAVEALMKGSLHTDELMSAVVAREGGLRTMRRVSHVFVADVPRYPRPLLITDAAINIDPSLEDKVDIVQNAIELAHALGIPLPRVAILSAVETVTPKIRSTLEAAALCKMADRGQIKGGLLDGPLAFDNAVSMFAAKTKGIESEVAGRADILVVPDLESGNMLAKQLEYLAGALMAGVVLGTKVPIVLTSRADTTDTRVASCAVALRLARQAK